MKTRLTGVGILGNGAWSGGREKSGATAAHGALPVYAIGSTHHEKRSPTLPSSVASDDDLLSTLNAWGFTAPARFHLATGSQTAVRP